MARRKIKMRGKKPPKQTKAPRPRRVEPELGLLARGLRSLGGLGGRFIGGEPGAQIGNDFGASISKWLGAGDYEISNNSIIASSSVGSPSIPSMHNAGQSVIVRHKEYIRDVVSSATPLLFEVQSGLPLNPGMQSTFPWLSGVAQQFQEYTIKGLVFHFISNSGDSVGSTNTALGTVILGTQYRASAPVYTDKTTMLNEYFSCDAKPSVSFAHPIECDPKENPYNVQYIRSAAPPTGEDIKTYDLGTFYVATQGMQAASVRLGELWCTYEIELRKPILNAFQDNFAPFVHFRANAGITVTTPFGTPRSQIFNNMNATTSVNTLAFPAGTPTGRYLFSLTYTGPPTTCISGGPVTVNLIGCTQVATVFNGANQHFTSMTGGILNTNASFSTMIEYLDDTVLASIGIVWTSLAGMTAVDIMFSQVPAVAI